MRLSLSITVIANIKLYAYGRSINFYLTKLDFLLEYKQSKINIKNANRTINVTYLLSDG